jgi:ribonuclease Z
MSARELVVLGTASQVPTRERNHNGYVLRWDNTGLLFDPGEGSQRQMLHAGLAATDLHRILITHFHGDHCLGLPGVLARISLDEVAHEVTVHYPASGQSTYEHLAAASLFHPRTTPTAAPIEGAGEFARTDAYTLSAATLEHSVDAIGYRLVEPDGRRMLPSRLAEAGISGPDVGVLQREGVLVRDGRTVTVEDMSEPRPGQSFAFVMDTRVCDAVHALAAGVDMLVAEATYLNSEQALATAYGHMTAADAGRVAQAAGVRTLVLTHFSQRYPDLEPFAAEAAAEFAGTVVVARDLDRIPLPPRR